MRVCGQIESMRVLSRYYIEARCSDGFLGGTPAKILLQKLRQKTNK